MSVDKFNDKEKTGRNLIDFSLTFMSMAASAKHRPSSEIDASFDVSTAWLRMRAMCNDVKAALLKDSHDPHCAQPDLLVACPTSPAKDAKTWLSWWNGTAKMQAASKAACDRINRDVSRWIEFPHLGAAVQRHLAVLDAVLLSDDHKRENSASECLAAIANSWSLFTTSSKLRAGQTDNCIRLLAGKAVSIAPNLRYADERGLRLLKLGLNNPFFYSLPSAAPRPGTRSSAEGMLTFLLGLTRRLYDVPPEFMTSVVFDIASCVALVRADRDTSRSARLAAELHARAFWDHAAGADEIKARFSSSLDLHVCGLLRADYYRVLREHGISFRDIYRLMAPVKVLGEVNIWKNVTPAKRARAMGKYVSLLSAGNRVVFARAEEVEVMVRSSSDSLRRVRINAPRDDVALMEAIECARTSS